MRIFHSVEIIIGDIGSRFEELLALQTLRDGIDRGTCGSAKREFVAPNAMYCEFVNAA